jgi:chromosome segregation ATPase
MWALLGVFLLAFGSLGLTTCSDDSHRIAELEKLRLATQEQTVALETQQTQFASLESSSEELRGELDAAIAERDEKTGVLAAVSTGLAAIGIAGVSADTAAPEAVALVADGYADIATSREALSAQLTDTRTELTDARAQLESMADSQAMIDAEHNRVVGQMQTEFDSMRGALDDAELDADKLREQLKSQTGKTARLETANAMLMTELESLKADNGDLLARLAEAEMAEPVTQAQGLQSEPAPAAPDADITAQLDELRMAFQQNSQGSLLALKQEYETDIRGLEAELEAAQAVSLAKEEENSAQGRAFGLRKERRGRSPEGTGSADRHRRTGTAQG